MCDNIKLIYIRSRSGKRFRLFTPCGKCPSCMDSKRAQLVQRFKVERLSSKYVWFITLTYSNENLKPLFYKPFYFLYRSFKDFINRVKNKYLSGCSNAYDKFLLNKQDAKDFIHSFQKWFKSNFGYCCKYYLTGEYGTVGKRPHLHSVIFTKDDFDPYYLKSVVNYFWKKGNVSVFRCTDAGLNYVAKHQCKYDCGTKLQNKLAPIFSLQSIKNGGIGINMRNDPLIISNYLKGITYGRIKDTKYLYSLPRYVLKYLHPENFSDSELHDLEIKSQALFLEKAKMEGYDFSNVVQYIETNDKYKQYMCYKRSINRNIFLTKHSHRFNKKYLSYRRNLTDNSTNL